MPIIHNTNASNGAAVGFHTVETLTVNLRQNTASVTVNSYASESAYLAGMPLIWHWTCSVPVNSINGEATPRLGIEAALTSMEGSPFRGGSVTIDQLDSLDTAKTRAWNSVKADRDKAEAEPFEFEGGMYDPNKQNIVGAAFTGHLAMLAGQEVSDEWTLADDTKRVLTGAQLISLGLTLTQRVKAIHLRGRQLRDLITNATTPEEAYGYTWDSLNA